MNFNRIFKSNLKIILNIIVLDRRVINFVIENYSWLPLNKGYEGHRYNPNQSLY